jgi:hypothetical protein
VKRLERTLEVAQDRSELRLLAIGMLNKRARPLSFVT